MSGSTGGITARIKAPIRGMRNAAVDAVYWARTRALARRTPRRRCWVLYLYADRSRYPRSYPALERIVSGLHGYDAQIVLIDNFNEGKPVRELSPGRFDMGGDNTQWEFTGWRVGMDFIRDRARDEDVVLFANDSFLNRAHLGYDAAWFRHAFNSLTLDMVGPTTAMGRIWEPEVPYTIGGRRIDYYLQTHFLAVGWAVCRALSLPFVRAEDVDALLPVRWNGSWFTDSVFINDPMKKDIQDHLTGSWQFRLEPSEKTWPVLRGKSVATLNESLFTREILDKGGTVLGLEHGRDLRAGRMRVRPLGR
jgi:hypothetical protein